MIVGILPPVQLPSRLAHSGGQHLRGFNVAPFGGKRSAQGSWTCERGIAWRCSDSMSLRDFLRLENREEVPDHSWLSKTRGRLPREVHERVFGWVLQLVAEQGLVKGKRIGVDASTMEANAALRTIVRREETSRVCTGSAAVPLGLLARLYCDPLP